jgi:Rrf2 family protein
MISKKMKYALKALIYMAKKEEGFAKTSEIAQEANIPKKFLEQILIDLKKGQILNSKQGNTGGYYFLKKPAEITLASVYRLIDGPIALIPCASKMYYEKCEDCQDEATCAIRLSLIKVRDETLKILESQNIEDLC